MKLPSKKSKVKKPFYKRSWFIGIAVLLILGVAGNPDDENKNNDSAQVTTEATTELIAVLTSEESMNVNNTISESVSESTTENSNAQNNTYSSTKSFNGYEYKIIKVDGGDTSGYRESNVAVNVGFGNREYWAFTNEYGQLVAVTAQQIIPQDPNNEPVLSTGRYFEDEAKVPGTEDENLDEGHVIADSLGGVSNAYNITPQDSTLNRYGDQAYMEKVMRDAGGCTNFVATITYADNKTQIPSHYKFEYELNGNKIVDEFDNVNPDVVNATSNTTVAATSSVVVAPAPTDSPTSSFNEAEEVRKIDSNGNGQVTIKEAKAAGFSMPIYSSHWLYKYMDDRDGDGAVGE
jgi:hypothetical protein